MKDQNNHENKNIEVTEHYKEEGAVTLETLEVAAHDAHTHGHAKHHASKGFVLTTPLAIIIASVIIAGGLMGYGAIMQGGSTGKAALAMFKGKAIDAADYIEGKENSKVIVVEYSDPECPFCVQLSPTIEKIRSDYAGKIAFVYRHFPLTQIHKNAFDESRAIACAGKIGGTTKYYEYIDTLYRYKMSKQTATLPSTGKEDFARTVGLDMSAFGITVASCTGCGGAAALSAITAAAAGNIIASGNNSGQVWNWTLTSDSVTAFIFGETAAATNGTADQNILGINIDYYHLCCNLGLEAVVKSFE